MTSFPVDNDVIGGQACVAPKILGWTFICHKNFWISTIQNFSGARYLRATFQFSKSKKSSKKCRNPTSETRSIPIRICWIRWAHQFSSIEKFGRFLILILQATNDVYLDGVGSLCACGRFVSQVAALQYALWSWMVSFHNSEVWTHSALFQPGPIRWMKQINLV